MNLSPYIFFSGGKCREAFTLYHELLGGDLELVTGADMPASDQSPPEMADLIMHAYLKTGDQTLMGSDDPTGDSGPKSGVSISYSSEDSKHVTKLFEALSSGGQVTMPLTETSWSPGFGMCIDRFGTPWMLSVEAPTD